MNWKLWIAQGFGVGRIPVAPGTFGSVLGLGLFALLLLSHSLVVFAVAIVMGSVLSVWLCGEGEKILGKRDPGSVVLDEIIAIPLCFACWLWFLRGTDYITPNYFFHGKPLFVTIGIFCAFRLFDVWKPWPVRQSQNLPGGLGVTVDDLLAAVYVNAAFFVVSSLAHWHG